VVFLCPTDQSGAKDDGVDQSCCTDSQEGGQKQDSSNGGATAVSETVNGLSMADAFRYYRDELKWHVYPADGPESKKEGAGKKPSVTKPWEYDPQDCDGTKWFNGSGCHNIGFAPRDRVVVVDLDSKPDQGKSVEAFLAERQELMGTPWHRTRGGVHLVYRCRDLPEWKHPNGLSYHDTLKSQISTAVSAELFHSDHSNVVLPPSVHAVDGFVYRWENFGEIADVAVAPRGVRVHRSTAAAGKRAAVAEKSGGKR
jgi:hypothetical protein